MRDYLLLHLTALFAGIWLDIMLGDPKGLPHPVRAIGWLISSLERSLYKKDGPGSSKTDRFVCGTVLWFSVMLTVIAVSVSVMFAAFMAGRTVFFIADMIFVYYALAAGSLRDETMAVYNALPGTTSPDKTADSGIDSARKRLSMIVGRDTENLDEAGIERAAVETVAENTSDGVLAPLIYTAIGGPVIGFCYKAVNTMDSMLGYKNERYEDFGRFAARADDLFNLIPARISAVFMLLSAGILDIAGRIRKRRVYSFSKAWSVFKRDRYAHKSPNSAQTESVCAGALSIRLGGPSSYGGKISEKAFIGDDHRPIVPDDIKRAIRLMFLSEALCTAAIFITMTLILISR